MIEAISSVAVVIDSGLDAANSGVVLSDMKFTVFIMINPMAKKSMAIKLQRLHDLLACDRRSNLG
jgi:hypothetical protein